MFGYIYKTTNKLNGRMYIGKHKWHKFENHYYGSGKAILAAIEKDGIENFTHEMLYQAETKEELDAAEMRFIKEYRAKYGDLMYNQASGGDGGDVFRYADDKTKEEFVAKMTEINRARCGTEKFRKQAGEHLLERWKDLAYRMNRSKSSVEMWNKPGYRENHIAQMKAWYKANPDVYFWYHRRTLLVVNGERLLFNKQLDAINWLKKTHNFCLCRPSLRRLERISKQGAEYKIFHYNKFPTLRTLQIFYVKQDDKSVETKGDECNPVSLGFGARLKCATDDNGNVSLEEIVQSK